MLAEHVWSQVGGGTPVRGGRQAACHGGSVAPRAGLGGPKYLTSPEVDRRAYHGENLWMAPELGAGVAVVPAVDTEARLRNARLDPPDQELRIRHGPFEAANVVAARRPG